MDYSAIVGTITDSSVIFVGLSAIGSIGTFLVAFLLGKRNASGRVNTSEAATLWIAADQFRKDLQSELKDFKDRLSTTENQLREALIHTAQCERDNLELRARIEVLEREKRA